MKPLVIGKKLRFREVVEADAEFILSLRTDPEKNRHLHSTSPDLENQRRYIRQYKDNLTDFYFLICDLTGKQIGTVRIYDIQNDSFCWGSWILADGAPVSSAIESALLVYDFAFFALHFKSSHFDVRKENARVVDFHRRFGAEVVGEDDLNYYFRFPLASYLSIRSRYLRFLP